MYYQERVLLRIELAIWCHEVDTIRIRYWLNGIEWVWRSVILGAYIQLEYNLSSSVVK